MTRTNRMSFKMVSFVHETLYGLFRDLCKALNDAGLEAGQQVLEVGCGPGFFTVPVARIVGEMIKWIETFWVFLKKNMAFQIMQRAG